MISVPAATELLILFYATTGMVTLNHWFLTFSLPRIP